LEHELWIAESDTRLVGILVLDEGWIDQLYVDPARTGSGVGSQLVDFAKRRRPRGLRLWTFASNRGARRFYARHGFVEVERTDGSRNDSNAPDIQFAYRPGP
jgi:GNAT superfamily N-acetyltransferase